MRLFRLIALLLLVPLGVGAQVGIVGDSTLPLRSRVEPVRFVLPVPPELGPAGILQPVRSDAATLAAEARARLATTVAERQARAFQRTLESPRIPEDPRIALVRPFLESQVAAPRDTTLLDQYADLGLQLSARLESKLDRQKNERCTSSQLFSLTSQCQGTFQPTFDFQFNVRTGGVVADRVHVNVDYDSQREFDASNNISVFYQGKSDELLKKIEVGNVSFTPPPSRFITSGIPSNNYGLQTEGQIGPMRFRGIVAQQ
ncbi:MAG: hypothetical protein K2X99_07105, partial [Gemmatimonadaceae bacterium]|nr:hypothetical protein [Gemmatimonadaceae bacterium]